MFQEERYSISQFGPKHAGIYTIQHKQVVFNHLNLILSYPKMVEKYVYTNCSINRDSSSFHMRRFYAVINNVIYLIAYTDNVT